MTQSMAQPVDLAGISAACTTRFLIQRLEYWFRGKKKKHFFKFLCPCDHKLYRAGDSWTEEMGVSRKTFLRHFDKIGTRWPSKSAFDAAPDAFLGKAYACYYDRKENMTRYFKNPGLSRPAGADLSVAATTMEKARIQTKAVQKLVCSQLFSASNQHRHDKSRPVKTTSPLHTRNTSDKSYDLSSKQEKIAKEVQEIWTKEVGGVPHKSASFLKKLYDAFNTLFQGSLKVWGNYCRKVASSKFLMGEVTRFKAWLSWAIKPETVEKLEAGEYTLGDRTSQAAQADKRRAQEDAVAAIFSKKSGKDLEFHQKLRGRVGDSAYLAWFTQTRITLNGGLGADEDVPALVVYPTSPFSASYIKQNFANTLEELARGIFGATLTFGGKRS